MEQAVVAVSVTMMMMMIVVAMRGKGGRVGGKKTSWYSC
jgi:hypothetical protein